MLFSWAKDKIEEHKENWATGAYLANSTQEVLVKNAVSVGYCNALSDILGIEWEDTDVQ